MPSHPLKHSGILDSDKTHTKTLYQPKWIPIGTLHPAEILPYAEANRNEHSEIYQTLETNSDTSNSSHLLTYLSVYVLEANYVCCQSCVVLVRQSVSQSGGPQMFPNRRSTNLTQGGLGVE